jgi:hypothetical protein
VLVLEMILWQWGYNEMIFQEHGDLLLINNQSVMRGLIKKIFISQEAENYRSSFYTTYFPVSCKVQYLQYEASIR